MSAFATVSHTISGIKERWQKVTAEKLPGKSTLRLGLGPLVIEDFLVFLIRSASAKRKVILIRRAHAILESLYLHMHLFEPDGALSRQQSCDQPCQNYSRMPILTRSSQTQ
jgi:hypothetical protein